MLIKWTESMQIKRINTFWMRMHELRHTRCEIIHCCIRSEDIQWEKWVKCDLRTARETLLPTSGPKLRIRQNGWKERDLIRNNKQTVKEKTLHAEHKQVFFSARCHLTPHVETNTEYEKILLEMMKKKNSKCEMVKLVLGHNQANVNICWANFLFCFQSCINSSSLVIFAFHFLSLCRQNEMNDKE